MSDKKTLRSECLARRDTIPVEVKNIKDRLIRSSLMSLEEFARARSIFLYASFRSEVDTLALIKDCLAQGKRVILPRVDLAAHSLGLYEIISVEELAPGYMKIPEPVVHGEVRHRSISDMDIVILPGACFDPAGNRIGYGGGYYDRLLSGLQPGIPVIAPAYEEQMVEDIPAEPHDVRVSIIVTDKRVLRV